MRRKSVGLGAFSVLFSAMIVAACSASGNDVGGVAPGPGAGSDSGAVVDAGYGASSDSGEQALSDSGKTPPKDSGSVIVTTDAGSTIAACDLSGGATTFATLAGFLAASSPDACGSDGSCATGECCLDFTAALGGGSTMGLPGANACITPLDLSALGF